MSLYTCNLDLDEFTLNPVIILPASTWTLSNRLASFWVQLSQITYPLYATTLEWSARLNKVQFFS
jgi:hypothetical protein